MIMGISMKDHTSSAIAAARASQVDPTVMYLIVRESLNMGMGKVGVQCAHASQMLQLKFNELEKQMCAGKEVGQVFCQRIDLFREWLNSSFRKVVLKADEKEWSKVKTEILEDKRIIVIDAGLTEVPEGSETCMALWPMYRSQVPKIIRKLQAMK